MILEPLFHSKIIGFLFDWTLLSTIFHTLLFVGTLIFSPMIAQPDSIKYPSSVSLGFKNVTFLIDLRSYR